MTLIIIVFVVLALTALELRRRVRKKKASGGRYRAAVGGLNLDREQRPGARKGRGRGDSKSLAGPVILGLVTVVLCLWLGASYFLSEGDGPSPGLVVDSKADAAPLDEVSNLAGTLTAKGSSAVPAAAGQSAAQKGAPLPPRNSIASAAQAVTSSASRLDRIGLMPGRSEPKPATAPKTAASEPASQSAVSQANAQSPPPASTPAAQAKAPAAKTVQTASTAGQGGSSSLPAAASASSDGEAPAAASPGPLSSGGRSFTLHLGSFGEEALAEKYRARLVEAGESAFVSRATVDGKLWFRVMSGRSFDSRRAADSYGQDLKRRGLTADNKGLFWIKPVD